MHTLNAHQRAIVAHVIASPTGRLLAGFHDKAGWHYTYMTPTGSRSVTPHTMRALIAARVIVASKTNPLSGFVQEYRTMAQLNRSYKAAAQGMLAMAAAREFTRRGETTMALFARTKK